MFGQIRADAVDCVASGGAIETAAERLAVDRDVVTTALAPQLIDPPTEQRLEGARVHCREYAQEGVLRGNAMLQRTTTSEPLFVFDTEDLDGVSAVGSGENPDERDEQNLPDRMPQPAALPWVRHVARDGEQDVESRGGHHRGSGAGRDDASTHLGSPSRSAVNRDRPARSPIPSAWRCDGPGQAASATHGWLPAGRRDFAIALGGERGRVVHPNARRIASPCGSPRSMHR